MRRIPPYYLSIQLLTGIASLVAQLAKNSPAMQETQVQPLGREDPLEKEMVTHPSILAWEIPWTEEPGGLQSTGLQELDTTWWLSHHHYHMNGVAVNGTLLPRWR